MLADQNEKNVQTSPLLVTDAALNAYVRGVVCKIAGARCPELRVYIAEIAIPNAYVMPNGAVVVWTGLLLRVENEAQLAMVLGHEMTHYFHKHSLKNFQTRRDTGNVMAFLGLGGLYSVPLLLIAASALTSYSRDQEREADNGGFDLATAAGYDPAQAAEIWRYMAVEDKADPNRPGHGLFGSDHPSDEERLATMTARGAELASSRTTWNAGVPEYRMHMTAWRNIWLEDEMARGNGFESTSVLERLVTAEPNSGLLQFYLGEAYRRRNGNGDLTRAASAYATAAAMTDAPAGAFRELALLQMKGGDKDDARANFNKYLARAANADDRAMIEFYLSQVGSGQ